MTPGRNLSILFIAHAVLGSQMPVNVVLGGLAGAELADNRALATLPLSIIVLASMFWAPVASVIMGRYGRRVGFLLGSAAGALGGALAARALFTGSFELLLAGSAFTGIFQGTQGFMRFAASDAVPRGMKPKAIAWVLAAGLIAALIGPEIVRNLSDAFAGVPYAGAYVAVVAVNLLGAVALIFLQIPLPSRETLQSGRRRPVTRLLRQPRLVTAVFCGMISYAVMSLVMTPTSLAMSDHGFHANQAADVVRWHVVAMYAPGFFTGHLISRFGHLKVIAVGLALLVGCASVALSGVDIHHFYFALILLGIGWNFGFIGATSLLAETHRPEEQTLIQGLNDFLVFGLVAAASFSSGALLDVFGWTAVQIAVLPPVALALGALFWCGARQRKKIGSDPIQVGSDPF